MKSSFPEFEIIDISPEISTHTAVYPGDIPFRRIVSQNMKEGDPFTLSSISTSVHIGAHADGPNHYYAFGVGIGSRALNHYLGPCQVIEVKLEKGKRIMVADLHDTAIRAPRILFKTLSFPDLEKWSTDYNSLSPELVEYLAKHSVVLVGIDTPSVDPDDSKALESHNAIYRHDLAILEGLVLDHVAPGEYFLTAAPLKIRDGDASPVRAALLRAL